MKTADIVYVVSWIEHESEPVVTVFNNEEAARKFYGYSKDIHDSTTIDRCPVFREFLNTEEDTNDQSSGNMSMKGDRMSVNNLGFGGRVDHHIRRINGISQRGLAEKSGISAATLNRYIHGTRIPKSNIVARIAKALGVTSDYLLCMDGADEYNQTKSLILKNVNAWTNLHKMELAKILLDSVAESLEVEECK